MNSGEATLIVKKYMQENGFDNDYGCIFSADSPISTKTSWVFTENAIHVPKGDYLITVVKYLVNKKNKFCLVLTSESDFFIYENILLKENLFPPNQIDMEEILNYKGEKLSKYLEAMIVLINSYPKAFHYLYIVLQIMKKHFLIDGHNLHWQDFHFLQDIKPQYLGMLNLLKDDKSNYKKLKSIYKEIERFFSQNNASEIITSYAPFSNGKLKGFEMLKPQIRNNDEKE